MALTLSLLQVGRVGEQMFEVAFPLERIVEVVRVSAITVRLSEIDHCFAAEPHPVRGLGVLCQIGANTSLASAVLIWLTGRSLITAVATVEHVAK